MELLRPLIPPQEPAPPPVIHPGEDKIIMLQKTAGAALKDIKGAFTGMHLLQHTP